jgi:HEAT repeat protein
MPPGDRVAGTIPQRLWYRLPVPLTCLAIAACALAAAAPTPPASGGGKTGDARSRALAYLQSHDVAVVAELRALASAPEKPLMAIAEDAQAEGLARARAVAALRLLPSPEVQGFLGKLVRSKAKSKDATDQLLLRRAAVALGWMGGSRAGDDLALLFENGDPEVRLDAAIGIGLSRAPDAADLLRRQLAIESVPRVRNQIERQLRVLAPAPTEPETAARKKERTPMRGGF